MRTTEQILGYSVYANSVSECIDEILESVAAGKKTWLACLNPHSYAVASKSEKISETFRSADWLVPDGIGIVLASRLLGGRIDDRITGADIFFALNERLQNLGDRSVYFLGSTAGTLAAIRERLARDWPSLQVVGTYAPPFSPRFTDAEIEEMIQRINLAEPDILWVGMTAPKQEEWIYRALPRLNVRFAAGIGAVFDFYTDAVRRPNPVFQKAGLEWLPRLIRHPKRLWRRTFVSAPAFLWHVLRARAGRAV